MAAPTLVRDVLYRVGVQLHDISPQFTRWTQRELVAWLNEGQKAIAKYVPSSCSRVDAIKLATGTKQSITKILADNVKPGDGTAPADIFGMALMSVVRNMGPDGLKPGQAIRLVDRESLDTNTPNWHIETGTTVSGFVYDPRTPQVFYITPGVKAETNVWVEIQYMANPAEISATGSYGMDGTNATTVTVDESNTDDLVNYILARSYAKDAESAANLTMSNMYGQQFVSSINAQATAITGVNPNLRWASGGVNAPAPTPRAG
jgi:hypothetical protein